MLNAARSEVARIACGLALPLALTIMAGAEPARAATKSGCVLWRADRTFSINQQGLNIVFNLKQDGNSLSGSTHYTIFATGKLIRGFVVSGHIDSSRFQVRVRWDGMSLGRYDGTITSSGRLRGWTFDEVNAGDTVKWNAHKPLSCKQHYRLNY